MFRERIKSDPQCFALAIVVVTMVSGGIVGCTNQFSQFYTGKTAAELQTSGWALDNAAAEPTVIGVEPSEFKSILRQHMEDGWIDLGYSSWSGQGQAGSSNDALLQARKVGAKRVLVASKFLGTSSYANTYYTVNAAFLIKRIGRPVFGVYYRRMTPDEQKATGTVDGLAVDVVVRGSPAAEAGIVSDDVITQIGSYRIVNEDEFREALAEMQGKSTTIKLFRRGELLEKTAVLESGPVVSSP